MYHSIEDQEKHPEHYVLSKIDSSFLEDEVFDLVSKPRQTQKTIGLYLKKLDDNEAEEVEECPEKTDPIKRRFSLKPGNRHLEREVKRNTGFWVDKPQVSAPLTYKLLEKYTVNIPRGRKKDHGLYQRPRFLELDYLIKLANAGLLYPDEDISDTEEEVEPDKTECLPLRKQKYKICDPCKEEKKKEEEPPEQPPKDLIEEIIRSGREPPFTKIPTGCQCDFYAAHHLRPTVWDNPFQDRMDMLRQHEMNKVMKPFKRELLNKNYEMYPPVKFMTFESGAKKFFPIYQISNL